MAAYSSERSGSEQSRLNWLQQRTESAPLASISWKKGTESFVPNHTADSEPVFGVVIVVHHVMSLKSLEQSVAHRSVMDGIVDHVVGEIPNQKSGCGAEEGTAVSQHQTKQEIKGDHQDDGKNRWHHQALLIVRIVVVDAMKEKMEAPAEIAPGRVVEHEAMQQVFREGPKEQPTGKKSHQFQGLPWPEVNRAIEAIAHNGHPENQRIRPVDVGKGIEHRILEQSNRLFGIGNV